MKVRVRVPATTANLGPGFDALGMALDLWNETLWTPSEDGRIHVTIAGEGAGVLPTDATNAIVAAALSLYDRLGVPCPGFRVHCVNRIPLGSGLGSSSAALLSGLLGANALLGEPLSREEILRMAIETEGHPDNVAPAMLGGLVVSILHDGRVVSIKLPARANRAPVRATVVLPDIDFPTEYARSILPRTVDRQDAIYNISRSVLVVEALRTGDLEMLGKAMDDRIHQPYRLPLIPGALAAMEAARRAGAAAVALSGAGPSLIAFSADWDLTIGEAMRREFERAGLRARVFHLRVTERGARVIRWQRAGK
ncbi:MAG: homoserine kinase [Anaerolineae bacterium]|nr:homoserine kinase [Anaerolineae bacterium]MCX8068105.1 homoserine kinase [Anaerolineae bacterium]MDW7991719.1 homoserine kinase [Anaerolineae bacterium]